MPKRMRPARSSADKTERILDLLQSLFILEGRKAGMGVEDIRVVLKIKKNRVTNITKRMKETEREAEDK